MRDDMVVVEAEIEEAGCSPPPTMAIHPPPVCSSSVFAKTSRPPPEPPPLLKLIAPWLSSKSLMLLENLYNEKIFSELRLFRPGMVGRDLDHIFLKLLIKHASSCDAKLANNWAFGWFAEKGFMDIPASLLKQYSDMLLRAGSIETFLQQKNSTRAKDRISSVSIDAVCGQLQVMVLSGEAPGNENFFLPPDWARFLLDIDISKSFAREGIPIFTEPEFVVSSEGGRCPRQYIESMATINAHIMANCLAGLGVVVPRAAAETVMPHFHLQNFGWAVATNKVKGRLTSNCSGVASNARQMLPLNSEWAKEEAKQRWSAIVHPGLGDICTAIVEMQRRVGRDEVVIVKEDVSGYFQLHWRLK